MEAIRCRNGAGALSKKQRGALTKLASTVLRQPMIASGFSTRAIHIKSFVLAQNRDRFSEGLPNTIKLVEM